MTDSELLARIEKLERDNRRLKRLGVAALVLVGALGLVAAARPVPSVIKAHEFDVLDGQGRVRIKLQVSGSDPKSLPVIRQFSGDGEPTLGLTSDTQGGMLFLGTGQYGKSKTPPVLLEAHSGQGMLSLENDKRENVSIGVLSDGPSLLLTGAKGGGVAISELRDGPNLTLSDVGGYSTEIGTTSLVTPKTGETHQTSAASIVMFGNGKHHVIWQAP